jgi:bile acid:Na+ symporter, BASS family
MNRIAGLFPLWALLGSAAAFLWPQWLVGLKPLIVPLLGTVMFAMGLTLTLEQSPSYRSSPLRWHSIEGV